MAQATGIDHLAIYVKDLAEAKKFFIEALGLIPEHDYGDEFFMKIGNQVVALFQGSNTTQTINHLAINVDDFGAIKKQLEKLGYHTYKGDMVDGPNGIRIQLVSGAAR